VNFFSQNRIKLSNNIDKNSVVVLFAGEAPIKIGDERYLFTPNRNFYYITGIAKQNFIFIMFKNNNITEEYLFIERFDEIRAKWSGAVLLPDECTKISEIENIKYIDEFKEVFADIIFRNKIENIYTDIENRYFDVDALSVKFSNYVKNKYPYINIKNIYNTISEFRTIKTDFEIENIKKAIDITKYGIYEMMKNSNAGMYEYEIEAYFDFILKKNGIKDKAFSSIAASGKNAVVLHYSDNNTKTKENDLILLDVGAQYNYYNADITRTFPVNGKFTERQKQIYNIVLSGQEKVISSIKPGIEFNKLNKILIQHYIKELSKIGILRDEDDISKYYYHNVSHFLGLETHDVGRYNEGIIKEGMTFTVEPGLYIEEESIGIRIEDDVVVTEKGCDVLSKDIIKTVDEIEKFMKLKTF